MNNKLLRTVLILIAGGLLGFGISWWWCHRGHDKDNCKGNGDEKCCHDKKHGKDCKDNLFTGCDKFKSKDSGEIVTYQDMEVSAKLWNNGLPLGTGSKMQGGQFHSSLINGLVQSAGPNGGMIHYVFGLRPNGAKMDTVLYLVGDNQAVGCPKQYVITALSYCPDRCPKPKGGE